MASVTAPRPAGARIAATSAAIRNLLVRLRVDAGVIALLALVVVVTTALVAALPRQLAALAGESLRGELERARVEVRSLTAETLLSPNPATTGDPFGPLRERGRAHAATTFPASVQDIVPDLTTVVDTIRYGLRAYPGDEPTAIGRKLTLRLHDGIEDHLAVLDGRLPVATDLVLTGPATDDIPLPAVAAGQRLQIVDGLVPGQAVPVVQVALTERTAEQLTLEVGDRILGTPDFADPLARNLSAFTVQTVAYEVSAVIELTDPSDPFWFGDQRLHQAAQRDTGLNTDFFAFAMVPTDNLRIVPGVTDRNIARVSWRYPVAPDSIDAANVDAVRDGVRSLEAQSADLLTAPGIVVHRTGLTRLLDEEIARRRVATNALSLAAVSIAGVALTTIGLVAVLVVVRRRDATALVRGRGASRAQLLVTETIEAAGFALPAAAVGWLVAKAVAGGPDLAAATLGAGVVALGAVVVLVGATVPSTRRPLRELLRPDTDLPTRSTRRVVLEVLAVVLALVALIVLRRRGVDLQDGPDPLVAVVPVLVAFAAGLAVVRLHRVPIAAAALGASRRRGLATAYGLRRAVRARANGPAVLVVMLAVSVGVFTSAVGDTIATGQQTAAWEQTGADIRVAAAEGDVVGRYEGLPGVETVAYAQQRSITAGDASEVRGRVDLLAVDVEAIARITAGSPTDLSTVPGLLTQAPDIAVGDASPTIPAVAPSSWFQGRTLRRGALVDGLIGATSVTFQIVAIRDRLLGLDADERPYLIVPAGYTEAILGAPIQPDRAYLQVAADEVAATAARLREAEPTAAVTARSEVTAQMQAQPLVRGVQAGYRAATGIALFLGALALVVVLVITSRDRVRELALLTTAGNQARASLLITLIEVIPPVAIAVVAGAFMGQWTGDVLDGVLDLSPFSGTPTASRVLADSATTLTAAAVILGVSVVLVVLVAIRGQRRDVTRILREGMPQ